MPITSTVDGTVMPSGTDAFDPNNQLKAYQDGAAKYHKFRVYADITARDTDPLVTEGWRCYVLATDLEYLFDGTAWQPLPLDTVWANVTYAGSWSTSITVCRYRLTGSNMVELTGSAKSGTGLITTLPSGFRPVGTLYFNTMANAGQAQISVASTGAVTVLGYYSGGTNAIVSLDGIQFPIN